LTSHLPSQLFVRRVQAPQAQCRRGGCRRLESALPLETVLDLLQGSDPGRGQPSSRCSSIWPTTATARSASRRHVPSGAWGDARQGRRSAACYTTRHRLRSSTPSGHRRRGSYQSPRRAATHPARPRQRGARYVGGDRPPARSADRRCHEDRGGRIDRIATRRLCPSALLRH